MRTIVAIDDNRHFRITCSFHLFAKHHFSVVRETVHNVHHSSKPFKFARLNHLSVHGVVESFVFVMFAIVNNDIVFSAA